MILRLFRHSAIVGGARLFAAILGFAFLAYAGRTLGPDKLGQLLLMATLVSLVGGLVNVGFSLVELREIAAAGSRLSQVVAQFLILRVAMSILAYGLLAVFLFSAGYEPELAELTLVMGATLFFQPLPAVGSNLFTGTNRVGRANAIGVVAALAGTAARIAALLLGFGVQGVVCADVITGAVTSAFWLVAVGPHVRRGAASVRLSDLQLVAGKIRPMLPVMLFNAGNHVVGTILLSRLVSPLDQTIAVGYFAPALSIARKPFALLAGFRQAVVTLAAGPDAAKDTNRRAVTVALKISCLTLALPFAVILSLFAEPIIRLLLGADFMPSALVLSIVGWAMASGIAVMPLEAFLLARGRLEQLRLYPVTLPPFLINVVICLILIPVWSHVGAAVALLVARLLYAALIVSVYRRHFGSSVIGRRALWSMILISAAVVGVSVLISATIEGLYLQVVLVGSLLLATGAIPLLQKFSFITVISSILVPAPR